jgi:hypothetical protein
MPRIAAIFALVALFQDPDPASEYRSRMDAVKRFMSTRIAAVGTYLAEKDQHASARLIWSRAIYFDPEHDDVRRRLGERRRDGGGWEPDPDARIKTANGAKKEEELARLQKEAGKRLADAEKAIGLEWTAIGNLAEKAGLKAEAEAAWREAVQFYPDGDSARKKLGYEKDRSGIWRLAADREWREAMATGLAKASAGAEDTAKSAVAEKVEATFARRTSEHFIVESSYLDQGALTDLVQRAEHCWEMFHRAFNQQALLKQKYDFVFFKDAAQYEKYIDAFHKGTDAEKSFSKKQTGWGNFPLRGARTGDRQISSCQDFVLHYPAQAMMANLTGGKPLWLLEGAALLFSSSIMDTAIWACVDMASTGTGGGARNLRDPKNWRVVVKSWIEEGKDPNIDELVKCTKWAEFSGAEAVKAWSLLDFLLTEHRERAIAFLSDIRAQKDTGEASMQKVFGWPLSEFDARWRTWARATTADAR